VVAAQQKASSPDDTQKLADEARKRLKKQGTSSA
jgi:hypothetical protein